MTTARLFLLIMLCGAAGIVTGLFVRQGEVTHLKVGMQGLELTVERQAEGMAGLGRLVQSAAAEECL